MSTIERRESATLPPLVAGERLDQRHLPRALRGDAPPDAGRADRRSRPHAFALEPGSRPGDPPVIYWLMRYQQFTKGVRTASNASLVLDDQSEVQPDILMYIPSELGGRSRRERKYFAGGPELVVEIARSSRRIDLGPKFRDYERTGVLEYLVVALDPDEIHWFVRREDRFSRRPPDPDGSYRSEIFPGLWLAPQTLFDDDLDGLLATLDLGLATPEHAEFVARLGADRG